MKTLLVTGGCGFIGANFIRYLFQETDFDSTIINVDALTYAGNPDNLSDIAKANARRYHFIQADICDRAALEAVFERHAIDTVCHFAAESHVDRSIVGPDAFIRTNVMGTFNLLEMARKYLDKMVLFHHVSTDEVFGSLGETGFFTETTPYSPNSPYSASKAASDHLVRAYYHTYGLPVTISNCSNNYGPYQFPEKLIPLVILNALENKPLPVYGDGQNIRDWLYVEDHCRAIDAVLQGGRLGETYNIGGKNEIRNLDIVKTVCRILDEKVPADRPREELISFVKDRPGHDRRYAIDAAKIERELGWVPAHTFEQGIRETVGWYLENQEWCGRVRDGVYREYYERQYAS